MRLSNVCDEAGSLPNHSDEAGTGMAAASHDELASGSRDRRRRERHVVSVLIGVADFDVGDDIGNGHDWGLTRKPG